MLGKSSEQYTDVVVHQLQLDISPLIDGVAPLPAETASGELRVERMEVVEEKELNHFSHEEHPLILSQVQKKDGVDGDKGTICYGCREQILEPQAYICAECNLFLHKGCAKLPQQITHPIHSQHPLLLRKEPIGAAVCDSCSRVCEGFTYRCDPCHFDLDGFCSNMEPRSIVHKGHEHPLIFQSRPATLHCNACAKEYRDSSYFCSTCPFWIHRTCALLPEAVYHKNHLQDHPLPLSRAYGIPYESRPFNFDCSDCGEWISRANWVFYCGPCRYYIHFKCLIPTQERMRQVVVIGTS